MNENRRQILEMLAAGKITADEAEQLLAALEPDATATADAFTGRFSDSRSLRRTHRKDACKVSTRARRGQ